ncbi:MAG TPA: tetratricopeptide repeat protein [Terriglobales bacterium]|nr:tetratricopeptide repeat protein [Terriglobales bacterium]
MLDFFSKLVQRSAVFVLLVLTLAAVVAFAAVSHLVTRFNLNQQARGRKLYAQGLADMNAGKPDFAIDEFRAALTCDSDNSQYQLNLGRALRDTGRLDEAESYLESLWERTPEDGTINLALARVAAKRGSLDDATRYYHNAMYGVWTSDADANRRKARIELIEFLLQKKAIAQARSELYALTDFLPADPALHLQAAQFLMQSQDYPNALAEYEKVLHLDHGNDHGNDHSNAVALAGAGEAAFRAGRYRTADRYLEAAVNANPQDSTSRSLHASASLILEIDPFVRRISDAERNRRIAADFTRAGDRLAACAQQKGIDLTAASSAASSSPTTSPTPPSHPASPFTKSNASSNAGSSAPPSSAQPVAPLVALQSRWLTTKRDLPRLRSIGETDLPDAIMDVVFQIEQQTAIICGEPQGDDQALLLISRDREDADQ